MLMKYMPLDLQSEFDRLGKMIDDVTRGQAEKTWLWHPRVDIRETSKELVIEMEVPGFKKDDIDVQVTGNVLMIQGTRERVHEKSELHYLLREREYGTFVRKFPVTGDYNFDKIRADLKDGVLVLSLPRTQTVLPKKIPVVNH